MAVKNLSSFKRIFREDRKKALIIGLLLLLILSFVGAVILNLPKNSKAAWFDETFLYRKKIVITNSGSSLTSYNLMLTLDTSTLISASKMQTDCDDLRVTDNTGNLVNYWIEPSTCNTSSTKIWTKVNSVPTGNSDLYAYYGNSAVSSGAKATAEVFVREIQNLTAMWRMEESSWTNNCSTGTLLDSSGSGNDGESCDNGIGPTTPVTGKFGNGVQLTGLVSNQVGFAVTPSSGITDNSTFSVAFWVKTNDTTQTSTVMYNSYTGPLEIVQEDGSGGNGSKLVAVYGGSRISSSYTFSETTTWHHVVVTRSSTDSTLRFYVDGSAQGTSTSGTPSTAAAYGSIGMKYGGGNRSFDGYMDEVSVYNRQLTTDEISDLYNNYGYATTNYSNYALVAKRVSTSEPSVGSAGSEETSTGPVGFWKLDEGADNTCSGGTNDVCDSMGKNDGAISNSTTWRNEELCVSGKCLEFDGSDDVVSMGSPSNLDDLSALSLEAWIRPNTIGEGSNGRILSKAAALSSTVKGWYWYIDSSQKLTFSVSYNNDGSSGRTCQTSETVELNKWQHVAITWSGSSTCSAMKLYINGDSKAITQSGSVSGSRDTDASYNFLIGNEEGGTRTFDGFIDDVKVYGYVRTAGQVSSDYKGRGLAKGASTVLGINSQNSYNSLSNGLVGYWKLDESSGNATDYSGNGTTLTDVNTVARVAGKFGNNGDFELSNSEYLYAADNSALSITGDLTVSAWIKRESASDGYFLNKSDNLDRDSYLFSVVSDKLRLGLVDSSNVSSNTDSSDSLSTGTWYHVAGTYNQATRDVRLYINGKLASSTTTGTVPSALEDNDGRFHLGATSSSSGTPVGYYDGMLDEARVYNRTLNPLEIEQLYNWAASPIGYWKLDENTGTSTTYDSSTSGVNLSLNSIGESNWQPGKYGSGLSLDGSADYAFNSSATPTTRITTWTIEGWVNPSSVSQLALAVYNGNDSGGYGFGIGDGAGSSGSKLSGLFGGVTWIDSGYTFSASNTWYHIAMTRDGTTTKFYVNGVQTSGTSSSTPGTVSSRMSVGMQYSTVNAASRFWAGGIDDVKIYDYDRSNKQIIEDMNGTHPIGGSPIASQTNYWNFDEQQGQTINDKGFSPNNGTLGTNSGSSTDDPTWKVAGSSSCKINGCLNFDGSSDYTSVPDSNVLDNSTNDFTITLWANSASDDDGFLVNKRTEANSEGYNIYLTTGSYVRFQLGDGSNTVTTTPGTTDVSDGTWHHIAMVVNRTSGIGQIWIDGKQDGPNISISSVTGGIANTETLEFGRARNSSSYYSGSMDEIKIYSSALTSNEIKIDYNAGSSISSGGVLGTQDNEGFGGNAPTGVWSMNENKDDTCAGGTNDACDRSGSANDGAKTSMSATNWVPGKSGSALNFDGSDDYVSLATSALVTATSDYTIEGWIKPSTITGSHVIFAQGNTGNNTQFLKLEQVNATIGYNIRDNANTEIGNWTGSISTDTWVHTALTKTGNTYIVYINGVGTSFTSTTPSGGYTFNTTVLGALNRSTPTGYFSGAIDEIKIYDYVRSPSQIAYDYNRGGPLLSYKFDECQGSTAYNSAPTGSGQPAGNNGTITPGASGNTTAGTCNSGTSTEMWDDGSTGKVNSALGFDGTNDYVTVADSSTLDITGEFTVSAWIKLNSLNAFQQIVVRDNASSDRSFGLYVRDSNKLVLFVSQTSNASTYIDAIGNTSLTTGVWYHVVGVFSPSNYARVYINGVRDGNYTSSIPNAMYAGSQPIGIGDRPSGTSQPLSGLIDEVRVYNYALTDNQIKNIFNNGAVFFGPSTGNP